jgi:hypothetical protein
MRRTIVTVLWGLLWVGYTAAQEAPLHMLQAAVIGLQDHGQAREASLLVREQPGVVVGRFDISTRNMMLQVRPECTLDAADLNALLAPLGISVRCFSRSVVGSTPFQHVDADQCGSAGPTR